MSKFKAVLFDWEGVIGPQDTGPFGWLMDRIPKEYGVDKNQAVAALGAAVGDFLVGRIDNQTFWSRVGTRLGVAFSQEFQETIWQDWHGATPLPEMEQLVHEIKEMGLRAVVFSNALPPSAVRIREIGGYEGFDAEILSCEVGLKKPDPAIYQKAIQAAQCRPEECIFVDDVQQNLVPARELGMTTILATSSKQVRSDLLRVLEDGSL